MPSPHYFTDRNGQIIITNKEKKDATWKGSSIDHETVAAAVSRSGASRLKLVTRDHIPVVNEQGGRGGSSYCPPPIFNNKAAMYRTFSGPRNIAIKNNVQQASNHREVSSQASLFMQSGQNMIVSASAQSRCLTDSPIIRRASPCGKDTSSSTGTLGSCCFHDDITTSKSISSIHVTDDNDNNPKHDLFPSRADLKNNDTTHEIKNARRDSDSLHDNEDIEYASTNNSTTSDETSSVSSSVGSGDSQLCNSNNGNSGNSTNKCADRGQEGGCLGTSSTAAAAALVGLQQKSVDCHESTDIVKPRDTDVISGRGNGANRRPGNIRFREIVTKYKDIYLYAKAADKKSIARNVVREVEAMNPPARFLHQDEKTGMWTVLDHRKILRKVAQALREPSSMRKFRGSSKGSVSSPQFVEQSPEIVPDVSSGQSKNEEQREQAAKWTPRRLSLRAPSDATENGTRRKRLLTRASVNQSDMTSYVSKKHRPESGFCAVDRYGEGTSDKALMSLQEVPMSIPNSSHNKMMNTAAQSLTGLSYGGTTPKNLNLSDSNAHTAHGLHTRGSVVQYLGNHVNDQIPSQFLGQCDISLPYFLNYRNMGIVSSSPSSLMTLPTKKKHTDTVDNNHAETLRNISIVASRCSDLTALYVLVRTGSDSFTRNSFLVSTTQTIKPTQYDVLINACDIHNHPGNLKLAESVQLSYADYMNAELSGNLKSNVINNVISSVTKENEKALSVSAQHPQDKHRGRFLLRYISQKKTNSSPSEAWFVLPKKKVVEIIESLLQQACEFILNPDPGDVLFGRKDLSRLSPGNIYFKSIVNSCKPMYMQSSTEDKLNYAVEIVGNVTSRPGRFLGNIKEMGMWMPLSFDSAIEKTQKHLSGEIKD